jgi:hypothetical protein
VYWNIDQRSGSNEEVIKGMDIIRLKNVNGRRVFSAFTLIPTLEQGRNWKTSSNRICERKELVALGFELGAEVNVEVPNPASVCSKGLTSDSK